MNWRARWARLSGRERMLIGVAGAVLGLAVLRYLVLAPFLAYRESLRDEIAAHRARLENAHVYLARAGDVNHHYEMLRARYAEIRTQLVPGDTPTLAAASLQDMLHSIAAEKGVNVQSTQVMREETIGDFRRIAIRLTVTGELRSLAEFLTAVEYGGRRVTMPFLEISRRGAVLRGQTARALAATIEVAAFLQGADDGTPADGVPAGQEEPAPAVSPETSPAAPDTPAAGARARSKDGPHHRVTRARPAVPHTSGTSTGAPGAT